MGILERFLEFGFTHPVGQILFILFAPAVSALVARVMRDDAFSAFLFGLILGIPALTISSMLISEKLATLGGVEQQVSNTHFNTGLVLSFFLMMLGSAIVWLPPHIQKSQERQKQEQERLAEQIERYRL